MNFAEFAEYYQPTIPVHHGLSQPNAELEKQAIELGEATHAFLRSETDLRTIGKIGLEYTREITEYTDELLESIDMDTLHNKTDDLMYTNTAGHLLQQEFRSYYFGLALGNKLKPKQFANQVAYSELMLAMRGTYVAYNRQILSEEKFSTPNLPYKLFSEHYATYRKISAGLLTEIDASHVLLDICREHPGFVLLPGTPQFERSRNTSLNADYLLLNVPEKRVVGIQVKTKATTEDWQRYNNDVVKLVSGSEDMDNIAHVRMYSHSSATVPVQWPGYISQHRLSRLSTNPAYMQAFSPNTRKGIMFARRQASDNLGNVAPRFATAKKRIGARVLPGLTSEDRVN